MKNTVQNTIEIHGLSQSICGCEAIGLSKCFLSYGENCAGDYIEAIGFNPNSGYTYIAVESGVSICSELGNDVEYLVTNFETGEETFFGSYDEALSNI